MLGDALIELSTFVSQLEALAQTAGALDRDTGFRSYATSLNSFLGVDTFPISAQYEAARTEGPVRMVMMNGGETDTLQLTCGDNPTSACPALIAAAAGATQLFATMAADGVREVVYFYYAEPFNQPAVLSELNALRPLLRAACENAPLTCHFLDLRPAFEGREDQYYAHDGLVFNDAGAGAAAKAVFDVVQRYCIAWWRGPSPRWGKGVRYPGGPSGRVLVLARSDRRAACTCTLHMKYVNRKRRHRHAHRHHSGPNWLWMKVPSCRSGKTRGTR